MTYTYDDVITTKDVATGKVRKEDIIGKQGWFEDTLDDALVVAGKGGNPSKVLRDVDTVLFYDNDDCGHYFFLPKKEPEKKYVPFDLTKKEDRNFLKGRWIKTDGDEEKITGFERDDDGVWHIKISADYLLPEDMLNLWRFEDGTPCGKLEEES